MKYLLVYEADGEQARLFEDKQEAGEEWLMVSAFCDVAVLYELSIVKGQVALRQVSASEIRYPRGGVG